MVDRDEDADQQRDGGQRAAGDEGQGAGGGVALAEVGQYVEADDDADDGDRQDVEPDVAAGDDRRQVFAGAAGRLLLASRSSMNCCIMSIGIGKTITVFRSTPISVSVCR